MTGAISHKLRSQRGASMLLALLFLLICSMVTASILMAAVSNAGKHRSNLEEHQVYLALSSAVSTLCDELNRCEYQGQYEYWRTETTTQHPDGSITTTVTKHFKQLDGEYTYADTGTEASLKSLLLADFDALFAKEIIRVLPSDISESGIKNGTLAPHTLTLTPDTGISDVDKPVHITLEVKESYAIYITAYLDELDTYQLEAELTPNASAPTLPPLSYELTPVTAKTTPMQWKLGWITIVDEEEGGAAGS